MTRAAYAALFVGVAITIAAPVAHAAYPPGGTPGKPAVTQGDTETMSFSGGEANTPYHGEVHSTPLDIGTTVSDSAGNLSVSFSTAGLEAGGHTVVETAPDGSTLTGSFEVVGPAAASSPSASPSSGSSGGLAFTGAKIGGLVIVALMLFAVGLLALRSGRQRRTS